MSRPLKFRVWSPYHGKFVINGGEFELGRLFENFSVGLNKGFPRNCDYQAPSEMTGYKIQQWTGLFDKDKKEIYEGDIAFYDPEPNECFLYKGQKDCLISWKDDETSHGWFISSKNGRFSWRLSRGFCKKSIVIIGNIFEHPHLLS